MSMIITVRNQDSISKSMLHNNLFEKSHIIVNKRSKSKIQNSFINQYKGKLDNKRN